MEKESLKTINTNLKNICLELGFQKNKYSFIKAIDENLIGTLSFGTSVDSKNNLINVNVIVGLSFLQVEKLLERLTASENKYMQSTISIQLGYLMPNNSFYEWNFDPNHNNAQTLARLKDDIQKFGFNYYREMGSIENLLDAYENRERGVLNRNREKYLPIIYFLTGKKEKGLKFIDSVIKSYENQSSDELVERFKKIAGPNSDVIVGGDISKLDPSYLEYAKKYREL